ncbi:vitellogenin-like [Danaus plexippus]|uniref:vitellogenin-like n=1 Tax=Danaus plexippus TaxID=13037 RepID=UPI002AB2AD1F|nr:vitellogenin-like [Danaus plexippus]
MKLLVLAATIVVVSSGQLSDVVVESPWPWQVGKLYRYDVETHTLARYLDSFSSGNAFRAKFTVRAKSDGYLQARLENPEYAKVYQKLEQHDPMPEDLKYVPVANLDKPFEIYIEGGRILSVKLPFSVTLMQENLIKGLIGSLQVDLTSHRNVKSSHDTYDTQVQQGLFRKMEIDVTGDCETLYTVSPAASEWRRELPSFASDDEPIEITKSKNYGHCHHRVDYHFGVPEGAEWSGTAHKTGKEQFINRATVSRMLVGKNGHIYKAETTSTVTAHPHLYGEQKAQVHGKVRFNLMSYGDDNEPAWVYPEGAREVTNLLYALTAKPIDIGDSSSSEKSIKIEKHPRQRRSSHMKSFVSINKKIVTETHGSSSSSESDSVYVNDDIPNINEPAYASLYMNPDLHGDKKQNPMNAQKLLQEIAQQLQNPNNMPKADTLSKFNILVRVIASMSYGQLSLTSRNIEIAKLANDVVKSNMWMIYRDAVAQAGTLPAFQQIKAWIESKKLEGEEAAEVISVLAVSLRYPTKVVMKQFFDLAMNPEVTKQMFLNDTALIAAAKLINMGQVNNETVHRYYPTHMYGRPSPKEDAFVINEILPRLSQELQLAIENGDSRKSQVYIKAIGELGHPAILDIFKPYLEGKIPASTYLRTRIIEHLYVLAKGRDDYVRAVLFSVLKNTAEPYEVRVAAIDKIFMSRPSTAMMMAMAQMTKDDPSIQVRAALKSAITSASELKNPRFHDLARTAAAVKDMLTSEEFGLQYSGKNSLEHYDRDEQPSSMSVLSRLGSKDSLLPKYWRYSWKGRDGGWDQETVISGAASSWQELFDLFADQMFGQRKPDQYPEYNPKYSAEKIADMLNVKKDDRESSEGSFYINLLNQRRYFAFNENDVKELGIKLREYLTNLKDVAKQYTKVVNRNQVSVMFPIATGVPFIYKYKEPVLLHVRTVTKGNVDFKDREEYRSSASINSELRIIYAENHDGNVGFLDTLGNQLASVGLVRKSQLNIPIKIDLEMKSGEAKFHLSPMEPEQDNTIAHYSVWPYSANQKKDTLTPISQDPISRVIMRPEKVAQIDSKFGQNFGSIFQLQGYSYSEDYRYIGDMLKSYNYLTSIIRMFKQKDIAQTHFNLRYLGKQSKNKGVTITVAYDTLYNQKETGVMPITASDVKDSTPNSPSRREELIKRVIAGIQSSRAHVVDLSAKFETEQKLEYTATLAIGASVVDQKIQFALFAGRNSDQYGSNQLNAVGRVTKPLSDSPINFQKALEKELKMDFEADILYNQKENIHILGSAERTKRYIEELQKEPQVKRCLENYARGNYYQHDCHEAVVMAHAPDNFKFSVSYKDVSSGTKNAAAYAYRILDGLNLWRSDINMAKTLPAGKLELNVDALYWTRNLNLIVNSRFGELRVNNIPIPEVTSRAVSMYLPISAYERILNYYTWHQYQPYCSVDSNRVRTFSNREYDYTLSPSWHVVMHDDRPGRNEDLVVLSRRPQEMKMQIYLFYRSYTGKYIEMEVQPAPDTQQKHSVQVKTNAKKVSEGELTTYWDDVNDSPLLEYYSTGDNVLMIKLRENRLRIVYDGERSVVLSRDNRKNIRGICGRMSGDPRDDYLTPSGLVDKPEYYGASYALIEDENDPRTQELQSEAKRKAYEPRKQYTTILQSDNKWQSAMLSSSEDDWDSQIVYRARNYGKSKGKCKVVPQVQYYENQSQICITTSSLPSCQSSCSGGSYKIQSTQVVCRSKLDSQFQSYRDEIKLGKSPKVSGEPRTVDYRVPSSCKS